MNKNFPYILVLGAYGMVGRVIFKYLHDKQPSKVYGTSRTNLSDANIFLFDVKKNKIKLENLKNKNYKYLINCIGVLKKDKNKENMSLVNSKFPIILDNYCKKNKTRLIHISTDAVFANLSGIVNENTKPNPSDYYGRSKLMGEVTTGINIRTSILGLDTIKHKGLLELVLRNRNKEIIGFTNQMWSGSTTLQLAQFIEWLTSQNCFEKMIKITNIIHFTPLGPVTKYEIIKTFSKLLFKNKVIKGKGMNQTRILKTCYLEEIKLKRYTKTLEKAFKELIEFDKDYVKTHKES